MTFLFISTDLHTGTSGDIVASKELEAMQQLATTANCCSKETNEKVIILDYNDIHPVPRKLNDFPFYIDALALDKVSHLENISDIRLAHFYGGCYPQTIRYLKSKGIKTTITSMMHNRDISIKEHESLYGKFPFNHISDLELYKMYIGGIRKADIVITAGRAPELLLEKEGAKKVVIIPHGCNIPDENKIKPITNTVPIHDQFNVGYLGAYGPDKGVRYLIAAWSSLDYKDSELLLGGANANNSLEPLIKRYGTGGKFSLLGYIQDVANFYNSISVYIQPSATEGFGIETVEAMSYGRPVICSLGAGSADCITDGETGFTFISRDYKTIAEKIQYFKEHRQELYIMSGRCKEAAKKYSWDKIKQRYIDLWRSLLIKEEIV